MKSPAPASGPAAPARPAAPSSIPTLIRRLKALPRRRWRRTRRDSMRRSANSSSIMRRCGRPTIRTRRFWPSSLRPMRPRPISAAGIAPRSTARPAGPACRGRFEEHRAMSVAFRRESDEEHKEPRFELPIPPGPNLVTAAGLKQAETRVAELKLEVARETDEGRLAELQRRLRYWNTRLATAELAPPPPEGEAGFGSRVTFRLNGQLRTIRIVGDD